MRTRDEEGKFTQGCDCDEETLGPDPEPSESEVNPGDMLFDQMKEIVDMLDDAGDFVLRGIDSTNLIKSLSIRANEPEEDLEELITLAKYQWFWFDRIRRMRRDGEDVMFSMFKMGVTSKTESYGIPKDVQELWDKSKKCMEREEDV